MIGTLEKKVVRGVSVVQQQQQLSIEILTNLSSIKTSTRYCRKSAVWKQKARSTSRYLLLSSKVPIRTIAEGVRYRYVVLSNRV